MRWREPGGEQKSRTYRNKPDKAQELKDFLDANGNTFALAHRAKLKKNSTAMTVSECVNAHIDTLRHPKETISDYRGFVRNHMDTHTIGGMPIDMLTRQQVIDWVDGLRAVQRANKATGAPLAHKSKKNIHALLSSALAGAVSAGKIPENVAFKVLDKEDTDKREPVYLSPADLQLLIAEVDSRYRLFLQLLADTGLRYNEAAALRPRDMDVQSLIVDGAPQDRVVIHVSRAFKRDGRVGGPKTQESKRTVACGASLTKELLEAMDGLEPWDLVFKRHTDGEALDNPWFHKNAWQPLMVRIAGPGKPLPRAPWIHEIRHAHCTHLLQAGVPVHVVQKRLGHEDPQTTLRVYSRLAKGDDVAAADTLEAARTALAETGPEQAQADGGAVTDALAALEGLAKLHGLGVLTDAEFEAKKADLLARI
ncbi:tyrosine-type recombinase/integrase [Galactobacter valiniphilus]|uniref:tyrosine-type recombinase/integrase n=1 Tax=Galactobacter valiniphilus TaxID=2676122 RepID=UPI001314C051|nr:tyrosine-type recombinase/integrase [Galactobacter valiniphilus]